MRLLSSITALTVMSVLISCTAHPTLKEQLSDKSPSQRHILLSKQCHSEAGKGSAFQKIT